jgi:hypothetical protein
MPSIIVGFDINRGTRDQRRWQIGGKNQMSWHKESLRAESSNIMISKILGGNMEYNALTHKLWAQ